MKITCVVENLVYQAGLKGEHGLSLWISSSEKDNILFDTGQSSLLLENASQLGLDIKGLKNIVLSHGHYDHTGGLKYLLAENPDVSIFVHPSIWWKKYRKDGSFIGFDVSPDAAKNFQVNRGHIEIQDGIFLDSDLFPPNTPAQYNKGLMVDRNGVLQPDNFEDEQYLIIQRDNGLILITACTHKGIIPILDTLQTRYSQEINTIIGGLHLRHESEESIKKVIKQLEERKIKRLYVNHCTGINAYTLIKNEFSGKTEYLYTGKTIKI